VSALDDERNESDRAIARRQENCLSPTKKTQARPFRDSSEVSPRGESRLYARIYTHARITCTLERRKKRRKGRKRKKRRGGGIGDAGSRLQTTRNSHRSRDFSASMGGELPLRRPQQAARTAARMVRTTRNFLHGNRVSSDQRARALPIASCGGDAAINAPIYWRGDKRGRLQRYRAKTRARFSREIRRRQTCSVEKNRRRKSISFCTRHGVENITRVLNASRIFN